MDAGIRELLGKSPSSDGVVTYIKNLAEQLSLTDAPAPEVKTYPDLVYFNYYKLGLSLQFSRKQAAGLKRGQTGEDWLSLEAIDVYNAPEPRPSNATSSPSPQPTFLSYPSLPLEIPLEPPTGSKQSFISIAANTTGKDFVSWLGEPSRKGGGTGPSSGSINIWCEWSKDGIMVEFGGEGARGPQAWDRGKDAVWKVITVFSPKRG